MVAEETTEASGVMGVARDGAEITDLCLASRKCSTEHLSSKQAPSSLRQGFSHRQQKSTLKGPVIYTQNLEV